MKGYLFHTPEGRLLIGFGINCVEASKNACGDKWEDASVSDSFGEVTEETVIDLGKYWMYFTNDPSCRLAPIARITGRPSPAPKD